MLRALVYLNADLASSIALRYACQLTQVIDMKLHSIHVQEPDQGAHSPGTGWVRRTWESALLKAGEIEIAQLINAEKSSCPTLGAPKMLIGDRENEILGEIQREAYDLFVEGELHSFDAKKLYDKIHSRLYRFIPCPVIIVKNLVEIEKVALVLRNELESEKLMSLFADMFKGEKLQLDLIRCEFEESEKLTVKDHKEINEATGTTEKMLAENQWTPKNFRTMRGTPQEIGDALRDYGLVACTLHRNIGKKSNWFQLLSHIPSPVLICWR